MLTIESLALSDAAMPVMKENLKTGLLLFHKQHEVIYRVSETYANYFTGAVSFPIPDRTTVHHFDYDELKRFRFITNDEFAAYNRAWDNAAPKNHRAP